jgi:TIR domain/Effector-associated domain 11
MKNPFKIFISYSTWDKPMLEMLDKHLKPIVQAYNGQVTVWSDQSILPGQFLKDEIRANLDTAELYLMLVSPDSLAADYIAQIEIPLAIERTLKNLATIIPIIVRPCLWEYSALAQFSPLPKTSKSVSDFNNQDEAFNEIAKNIVQFLKKKIGAPEQKISRIELINPEKLEIKANNDKNSLQSKIADGLLKEAVLTFVEEATTNNNDAQLNEGILLLSRYNQNERDQNMGFVTHESYKKFRNYIAHNLLELSQKFSRVAA